MGRLNLKEAEAALDAWIAWADRTKTRGNNAYSEEELRVRDDLMAAVDAARREAIGEAWDSTPHPQKCKFWGSIWRSIGELPYPSGPWASQGRWLAEYFVWDYQRLGPNFAIDNVGNTLKKYAPKNRKAILAQFENTLRQPYAKFLVRCAARRHEVAHV